MGNSRIEQLLGIDTSLCTWIGTIILSFLTMCIVLGSFVSLEDLIHLSMEKVTSNAQAAMGFAVTSFTLITGFFPKLCCMRPGTVKDYLCLCVFLIVFVIIEYTGFFLPLIFHGATVYFLVVEIDQTINSPTELQKDANKGALIAGAVFAVLTTVAVAVMAWFWCRFTRPSSELDYEEARREAEERAEREERDLEEQLQRQRRNEMLYASLFDFPKTGYSAIEPVN